MDSGERSAVSEANSSSTGPYGTLSVFELAGLRNHSISAPETRLVCRKILPDEAEPVQALMEKAGIYEHNDVARRLKSGREGFLGEVIESGQGAATAVTYGWVAFNAEPLGQTGIAFQPPVGDAYLYDFATIPAHRGQGYYPALLRFILADLAARHLRCAWIGTEPGNDISARSISRAGFQKVADTAYVPGQANQLPRFELLNGNLESITLFNQAQQAHIAVGKK